MFKQIGVVLWFLEQLKAVIEYGQKVYADLMLKKAEKKDSDAVDKSTQTGDTSDLENILHGGPKNPSS